MHLPQRQRNALLRLLPREHGHFRFRRQHRGFHRHRIRMRRDVVGHDQHRRLALLDEIAAHREHEVGIGAVHFGQEFIDLIHGDLGPPLHQLRAPSLHVVFVEEIARLGARAARLRQHGGDHAIGRALQQIPDEGPADAEAVHHELVDAEMIHQADMVVGVGIPGAIGLERAGRLAVIGVAQIGGDDAIFARELGRADCTATARRQDPRWSSSSRRRRSPAADSPNPFLIMDANGTFFVKAHGCLLPVLFFALRQHAWRGGHGGCGCTRGQYVASR